MKNINEIVSGNQAKAPARRPLTDDEIQQVGMFFARLRVIYGNQYLVNFPDESTEKFAKMEYARQICAIKPDRLSEGFQALHRQRQQNPQDWKFMDLDRIIGLVKTGGSHWSHRVIEAKDAEQMLALPQKRSEETKKRVSDGIAELRKGLK